MKIVIVGAGVSGMLAASILRHKHEVILIEKNNECGKKILKTGNGKCNFWHTNLESRFYETDDKDKLDSILSNQEDCLNYLFSLGIYPTIKDGYYYPNSREASSIRDVLVNNLKGVEVLLNEEVTEVSIVNKKIYLETTNRDLTCDKLIISSGSLASVKECNSYFLLKGLTHTINPVLPALTKLKCRGTYLNDWDGVRSQAKVRLIINNRLRKESVGEIQLARDGISGICVFDISGITNKALSKNLDFYVTIDFFQKDFKEFMDKRNIDEPLINSLKTIFNKKLINLFLKLSNIDGNRYYNDLTKEEKERLSKIINDFRVDVIGSNDYSNAQVCTGGVPLSEINEKTMESLVVPNFYITGEILDVDGICGGYNMSFAFITGYLAALAIGDHND
jgi:predicted Rossmann fold flavoprotein